MKLRWVYLGSRILQLRGRSSGVISGKMGQGEIAHAKFIKKLSNSVKSLLAGVFPLFAQTMHAFNRRKSGKLTLFKSTGEYPLVPLPELFGRFH